jgi:hypothetical protein
MDIYVHETPLPVGVAFDDDRCCVVAYDETTNIRAVLEARNGELSEWVHSVYERHRERAVPLEELYQRGDENSAVEGRRR